ncbi:MAG: endolytic transglycosylase MltG, partial [Hyphomonas sp.]
MGFLKTLFTWVFVLAFIACAALVAGWVWLNNEMTRPGPLQEEVVFMVSEGDSLTAVAGRLEEQGIISSAQTLLLKNRIDREMQGTVPLVKVGEYILEPALSMAAVLAILTEGRSVLHKITLPEGRTTAQLLRIIESDETLEGEMPEV